jgi:hypothetical protein
LEGYLEAIERKAITSLCWKKTNGIKQPPPNGWDFHSFRYRLKKLNLDN